MPDPLEPFFCFFLLVGPGVGAGAGEGAGVTEAPEAELTEAFLGGDGLFLPPVDDELARLRPPPPW